ncbi:MAG: hypothetical protein JEY94_01945 [Melioribacteraceae bacterium]|nr:hypothetical protein [Melioribacteraceae bacterium]
MTLHKKGNSYGNESRKHSLEPFRAPYNRLQEQHRGNPGNSHALSPEALAENAATHGFNFNQPKNNFCAIYYNGK